MFGPGPKPVPTTWEGEINELKTWLSQRLTWLDRNFPEEFILTANELPIENLKVSAFPNPFVDKLQVTIESQKVQNAEITFTDASGRLVLSKNAKLELGGNSIDFENISNVNEFLFLKVKTQDGVRWI